MQFSEEPPEAQGPSSAGRSRAQESRGWTPPGAEVLRDRAVSSCEGLGLRWNPTSTQRGFQDPQERDVGALSVKAEGPQWTFRKDLEDGSSRHSVLPRIRR